MKLTITIIIIIILTIIGMKSFYTLVESPAEKPVMTEEERMVDLEYWLKNKIKVNQYRQEKEEKYLELGEKYCGKDNFKLRFWGGEVKEIECKNYYEIPTQ